MASTTRSTDSLTRVESLLFHSSRGSFIGLMIGIALFKTGIWAMPNLAITRSIAANPFANLPVDPLAQYLFWNWLGLLGAWTVGAIGESGYFVYHALFAVSFTAVFLWSVFRVMPDYAARVSTLLFFALPVSGTIYYWIGMDAITSLLMLVGVLCLGRPLLTFVVCIALGMQHFEQGVAAGFALLVMAVASRYFGRPARFSIGAASAWILGSFAGKLALIGLFSHLDLQVNSGRLYWAMQNSSRIAKGFVFHFHFVIWSAFGLGWLAIWRYAETFGRRAIPFFCAVLVAMPLLLTDDETRVVALVTLPIVLTALLLDQEFLALIQPRHAAAFFIMWVLLPWSWAWEGVPRWSAFPYDVVYVVQLVSGKLMNAMSGVELFTMH